MIKNVLFDLGKVLVDYDFDLFFQRLGYSPGQRELSVARDIVLEFDKGSFSRLTFYQKMKQIFPHNLSPEKFFQSWCNIFFLIPEMVELAKVLQCDLDIFLLSNTDELHFPFIWKKFEALHIFADHLMLSYQLKAVKPDAKIYIKALQNFDLKPQNCLFIDDKIENVNGAEKLNITALHHQNYHQTKAEMENILKMKLDQ